MKDLNASYWDDRYKQNDQPWDLGEVSPPIKSYIDQLTDKSIKILIPGGGNSYEAEYLFKNGFLHTYVVDISKTALTNLTLRVLDFPAKQLFLRDYFELDMTFDLIIEQTFFCALHPKLRQDYVIKTNNLLSENGKLIGLLFNVPLNSNRPPFGGSKEDYIMLFKTVFKSIQMENAYNSHPSRSGRELFFIAKE